MSLVQISSCSVQSVRASLPDSVTRSCRALAICRANTKNVSPPTCTRRELLQSSTLVPGVVVVTQLLGSRPAWADDQAIDSSAAAGVDLSAVEVTSSSTSSSPVSKKHQVYLDVKVEGESLGRIVIELTDNAPVAAQRFADLAEGKQGVGYRLSKFDGIFETYIRNEGVKSLSYSADGASFIAGGDSVQALEEEYASSSLRHDAPGLVSLVVKEAVERPVKERLVAMNGKLVTLKEQAGEAPNGTGFMITTGPTPELDKTNLVVGKVVQGLDVVQAVAALPFAKPRDSYYDKPFFEAGKMMGDKRATVAEKRFNRPLKRVLVGNAGVL